MIFNGSKYNDDWPVKRLDELGSFNRGKSRHRPRNDSKLFKNGIYPLVQTGDVKAASLYIEKHSACYNEFGLSQSKLWEANTLCITIAANIAETALLRYPMCFPDSVVGFNANKDECSEIFMHYVFKYIRTAIQERIQGSIQDNINIEYLTGLSFRIPERIERTHIESILFDLDSKIELNNKINAELEAMAKLIYDYWFVQFDFPDKKGRPYKSSGGKMVYNKELKREIPEGWGVKELGALGNFKNGVNYDPSNPGDVACPIINVRNISASSYFLKNEDLDIIYLRESDVKKYSVHDGSIIIARSGIPGATRLIADIAKNTLYCGFAIHYQLDNLIQKIPIFFYLKSIEQMINSGSGGTILKNVNQATLNSLKIPLPQNDDLIKEFNDKINPMFSKINLIQKENQKLTELRDWLLPMLMNGQVRVSSAKASVTKGVEEEEPNSHRVSMAAEE